MNSCIFLVVFTIILVSSTNSEYFSQEGGVQFASKYYPNGSLSSASSINLAAIRSGPTFQIRTCEACKHECADVGAQRYDCAHENGLIAKCSCNTFQIWPTRCQQCEEGCLGYTTCREADGIAYCQCSAPGCNYAGNSAESITIFGSVLLTTLTLACRTLISSTFSS